MKIMPFEGPLRRMWYKCPHCSKKAVVYDNSAHCKGVYYKCKYCGKEFEIKI